MSYDEGTGSRGRPGLPVRGLLFLALAVGVIVVDQVTKKMAEDQLLDSGRRSVPVPLTGDLLRLTYVENRGAAFGLLQDQTTFFVIVGLVVVGVIAASYRYLPRSGFLVHLALGLQLGGAVGNLIDRLRRGYVVDFVDFGYRTNWWPVFNVADAAISVGVALLVGHYLLRGEPTQRKNEERGGRSAPPGPHVPQPGDAA